MNNSNNIEDLLLYQMSKSRMGEISNLLEGEFNSIFLFAFTSSVIFCFFLNFDFAGVFKRAVQGLIAVAIFSSVFIGAKDFGMEIGNKIISRDNFIWKDWQKAASLSKDGFRETQENYNRENGIEEEASGISDYFSGVGSDVMGFLIWIMSHIALIFTKISFTVVYNLILLSIPIVAIVNIFPMSSKALEGSLLSIMWIAVTPVIFALMLEILNDVATQHVKINSFSFIAKGIVGIIFSLYLISTLSISLKIVSQGTIGDALGSISQSAGTGMALAGASFVKNISQKYGKKAAIMGGQGLLFGSKNKSSMTRRGIVRANEGRESLFQKANIIRDEKAPTASELVSGKPSNFSPKEKAILAASTMAKPLETAKLLKARRLTASKDLKEGKAEQMLTTNYVKDTNGIKDKPTKTVRNGKVVKAPIKKQPEGKYYYDTKGRRQFLNEGSSPPNRPDGKAQQTFGYEKKASDSSRFGEYQNKTLGNPKKINERHHLATNTKGNSEKGGRNGI